MTTPSGWKNFVDGQVLSAAEINGYLQQGVLVFDSAAARDSALVGFVREGMLAYTKDNNDISFYNGTTWNLVTGVVEFASEAARNAAIPAPTDGRYAFTTDNLRLWKYNSSASAWREVGVNVSFASTAARDSAFPSPVNGQYVYITGTETTFVRSAGSWVRVGPNVETTKNSLQFLGSSSTTVPAWATKMYYCIVAGGGTGQSLGSGDATGGAGGQVVQGNVAVSPGVTITVTVGGAGANSAVAVSGGSTYTATGAGGAQGGNTSTTGGTGGIGTLPSAPFRVTYFAGGGGGSKNLGLGDTLGYWGGTNGGGGGYSQVVSTGGTGGAENGAQYSGGGGGARADGGAGGTGGSGIVLLYFS